MTLQTLLAHTPSVEAHELSQDQLKLQFCLAALSAVGGGLGLRMILSSITERRSAGTKTSDGKQP